MNAFPPSPGERFQLYFMCTTRMPILVHRTMMWWWKNHSNASLFSSAPYVPFRVSWAPCSGADSMLSFYVPTTNDTPGYRAMLLECIQVSVLGVQVDGSTFVPHGEPRPWPDEETLFFPNPVFPEDYERLQLDVTERSVTEISLTQREKGKGKEKERAAETSASSSASSSSKLLREYELQDVEKPPASNEPKLPEWVAAEIAAQRKLDEDDILAYTVTTGLRETFGIKPRLDRAISDHLLPLCLICGVEPADIEALPCEHVSLCESCFRGNYLKTPFFGRCPELDCLALVRQYTSLSTEQVWPCTKEEK